MFLHDILEFRKLNMFVFLVRVHLVSHVIAAGARLHLLILLYRLDQALKRFHLVCDIVFYWHLDQ